MIHRPLSILLIFCTNFIVDAQQANLEALNPYNDSQIGAALLHYKVERSEESLSRFTCLDGGARCVFVRDSFYNISFGKGQETQVEGEGATWAAIDDESVLSLGYCIAEDDYLTNTGLATGPGCVVSCNANCSCAVQYSVEGEMQACESIAQRPVAASPTASTTAPRPYSECPKQQFTKFCPELMNTGLPAGLDNEYECFNFCGGYFISSCDLDGNCGSTNCTNPTAAGTINGQVMGCVAQDKSRFQPLAVSGGKSVGTIKAYSLLVLIMTSMTIVLGAL